VVIILAVALDRFATCDPERFVNDLGDARDAAETNQEKKPFSEVLIRSPRLYHNLQEFP
jgi:hypothetical protein